MEPLSQHSALLLNRAPVKSTALYKEYGAIWAWWHRTVHWRGQGGKPVKEPQTATRTSLVNLSIKAGAYRRMQRGTGLNAVLILTVQPSPPQFNQISLNTTLLIPFSLRWLKGCITSPIWRRTIGPASSGFGRGRPSL